MVRIWKKCVLFYLGGLCYTVLEILWRGWSHGAMFLLGGACFLMIGHLGEVPEPMPVLRRAVVGSGIVTMMELGCGLALNRGYQIWDYRDQPFNFCGQICLPFAALWVPVSLLAIGLYGALQKYLFVDFSR